VAAARDSVFHVLHEALIERHCGTARFGQRNRLRKQPASALGRLDDGCRTMVLLYDQLDTLLDLGQNGMK